MFLGGRRLKQFMESVEKTTTAITGPVVDERDSAPTVAEAPSRPTAPTPDPWAAMPTGLALLEEVASASRASRSGPARDGIRFVQRDPDTGQEYLRIRCRVPKCSTARWTPWVNCCGESDLDQEPGRGR